MTPFLDLAGEFELGPRIYLDGANHGPLPRRSRIAAERAMGWKSDPGLLDDAEYFALPARIRASAAALLGAEPEDIAIATGASHGVGLVACGLDWRPGDRVVIPRGEFPANHIPWAMLRSHGVVVDEVAPDRIAAAAAGARVVSVGHVNFATGRRLPVEAIGAACREAGALFVIDAAQSFGALPVQVTRCGADVVAMAGYKWLMSPYGTGLTYVRPGLVDSLRAPFVNWATIEGADDFNRLVELEPRYRPGAARFDVPETAAFIHGAAMAESLELLVEIGIEHVFAHATALIDRIVAGLPEGFRAASPLEADSRSTILRVVADDPARTGAVHRHLRSLGVAVSLRESGLRVAPGLWNVPEHVDRFLQALASTP